MSEEIKEYFEDGQLKRLELAMLPRDQHRATGELRTAICKSFNYCRQYPAKLELFISIMKWATNYAMYYQAAVQKRKEEAEAVKVVEPVVDQAAETVAE